jgi:threonine aldolase
MAYSFKNDYSEGAHPRILEALLTSNLEQVEGYGLDGYTQKAVEMMKQKMHREDVDIHLLAGGTQVNLTALAAFIKAHEAVLAAHTGHILVNETGAIEATGHKVISCEAVDGKLIPAQIEKALAAHTGEHKVKPKIVYISNATEIGSVYGAAELMELSRFCRDRRLFLYIDGARLGSAMCAKGNDLELADYARLADAFYIGGTKNGALLGEALVICNSDLQEDFRFHMKQKGAMLAKGKLLGIQFLELFRDNLFFELAQHANRMATMMAIEISQAGYSFLTKPVSNQIFPVLPNTLIEKLGEKYDFHVWAKTDAEHSAIRLVTSWATKEEAVAAWNADFKIAVASL